MAPRSTLVGRRQFLTTTASALIGAHQPLAALASSRSPLQAAMTAPRLVALDLLTAARLADMERFYRSLGLPVAMPSRERLTVSAGGTEITFRPVPADGGQPFYHFAFNIPENKIVDALEWQKARGPLLPIPERNRDPNMPPEVVDYSHWNAHSIFFLDPGGNVVEYIARHDLKNARSGAFGPRDILYASEIAFVVDDVVRTAATLQGVARVRQYRGGGPQFTALGDEEGLLLVMQRGRILNFQPQSDEKAARVFDTSARVRGGAAAVFRMPGFPYTLTVEP
jgi:hypothetical protein